MISFAGAMRDSGVKSLGAIPAHWVVERNKTVLREINERSLGGEELLTVSHLTGVTPRADKQDVTMFLAESTDNCKRCQPMDLAINTMWAWMGALGIVSTPGIVSPSYNVYRFRRPSDHEPRYFDYLFRSAPYVAEINRYSKGVWTSRLRLYPESFLQMPVLLPPKREQQAIVNFLNNKTAAIDALIARKERLFELLEEKRQALITHLVTKGVDAKAPTKDTGVEWLGEVPTAWGVCRLKHVMSRIVDCPHETPEISPDFEVPAVRTTDVDRGRLNLADAQRVSEETYRERTRRLVPAAGDILYSREGRFGHAALVPPGVRLCLGQRMMMFRVREGHDPAYFMWALNAECVFRQVTRDTIGAVASRVNIPTVSNALVPCPPLHVQRAIAGRIVDELARIDRVLTTVSLSLTGLREYRQALVTAAVTGKMDVSRAAA